MATAPLRSLWGLITSIQGAVFGTAGACGGIYMPMELAGNYEQTKIAFQTMLGSEEQALRFLKEAETFANKTPFEFPELLDSSRLLLAFGFEAEKVLDIMTVIGDTSSGLGARAEGIERMSRAFGQMQAKGRIQAEEMLQLQEVGVPAAQILQEELGLTAQQVADIGKQSLDVSTVIDALLTGMEKRFGGMMDAQSKTAKGMLSTIKDTFQNTLLRMWGEGLWDGTKPQLEKLTKWIDTNKATIDRWAEAWRNAGATISKGLASKIEVLRTNISDMLHSPEWKSEQSIGGKVRIAWDKIIWQPFLAWWQEKAPGLSAVSYTHLDVYKRQEKGKASNSRTDGTFRGYQ